MTQIMMVPAGDVIPVFFSSYDGATGASEAISGLAVTDIEIYKDGSSTQRASDAGYTLLDTDGIDFDGLVGINGFSIDTGDNTDAGFYTVGAWFTVVVASVTADGQTVNFIPCQFRLMAAEGVAAVPDVNVTHVGDTSQTAGDLKAILDIIAADTTTDIPATLATIAAYIDSEVASILAAVDTEVAAIYSRLGAPAGASMSADIAAIEAQTDDIGVAGAGLTALGDARLANLDAAVSSRGTGTALSAAQVNAEVVDALATDTYAEPTGVPAATTALTTKIGYIYAALRNKLTVTSSKKVFFDDSLAALWEKDLTDDGTTYTETEGNAP